MGIPNRHTTLYVRHRVEYDHARPLTEGCCQDYSNRLLDIHSEWYLALACVLCKATAIIETTYSTALL